MRFTLQVGLRGKVFVPYSTHNRKYHIIFHKYVPRGTVLDVTDSTLLQVKSLFSLGDLWLQDDKETQVGHIFYTPLATISYGSAVLAYSKTWEREVNKGENAVPSGIHLLGRTDLFFLYHKDNVASMLVNPSLPTKILSNLEV